MQPQNAVSQNDWQAAARHDIDLQLESLGEMMRRLRTRRNDLAPIARLHPEVLGEIFSTFASMCAAEGRSGSCFQVTYVCQEWRNLALQLPRMWINVSTSCPQRAQEMLERSKYAPLVLHVQWGHRCTEVAMNEFSRMKKIHLGGRPEYISKIARAARGPGTLLETFRLESIPNSEAATPLTPIELSPSSSTTPRLRVLSLGAYSLRWSIPLPLTLTSLSIIHVSEQSRPSLGEFLEAIRNLCLLEELFLCYSLPTATASTIAAQDVVELPHLHLLNLRGTGVECTQILEHIRFPSNTHLLLNVPEHVSNLLISPRLVVAIERHLAPSVIGALEVFPKINGTHQKFFLEALALGNLRKSSSCLLSLHFSVGPSADIETIEGVLTSFISPLDLFYLQSLKITQLSYPIIGERILSKLVRRPDLKSLQITGLPPRMIFQDLSTSDGQIQVTEGQEDRTTLADDIVGFTLEHLIFSQLDFRRDPSLDIFEILKGRKEIGMEISELTIGSCSIDADMVSQLAEVVGAVHWDRQEFM